MLFYVIYLYFCAKHAGNVLKRDVTRYVMCVCVCVWYLKLLQISAGTVTPRQAKSRGGGGGGDCLSHPRPIIMLPSMKSIEGCMRSPAGNSG